MFRCGGEGGRIFCCMKEGDVGESGAFSVPLWGLGTPQGVMGGRCVLLRAQQRRLLLGP